LARLLGLTVPSSWFEMKVQEGADEQVQLARIRIDN